MGWDYSDLSRLAKQNGGPSELLAKHAAHHFKKGAASRNPIIAIASLAGLGLGIGGTTLYFKWKNQKNTNIVVDSELHEIEAELIAGMEHALEVEPSQETNQEEDNQLKSPEDGGDFGNLDYSD